MEKHKNLIEKIETIGFDNLAIIPTSKIAFEPSLIDLCKMNACGNYMKNYTCPPYIGETSELIEKARKYKEILVFNKIYKVEDSFDIEGMTYSHDHFRNLVDNVYEVIQEIVPDHIILANGGCKLCEICGAVENIPCRHKERAFASLESYSIQVTTLAEECGLKYMNGVNTVTFFAGVLF